MADSNCKVNTNVSRDLRPPIHSNPGSQSCVRKTFSASFVPQPAENHTFHLQCAGDDFFDVLFMFARNFFFICSVFSL